MAASQGLLGLFLISIDYLIQQKVWLKIQSLVSFDWAESSNETWLNNTDSKEWDFDIVITEARNVQVLYFILITSRTCIDLHVKLNVHSHLIFFPSRFYLGQTHQIPDSWAENRHVGTHFQFASILQSFVKFRNWVELKVNSPKTLIPKRNFAQFRNFVRGDIYPPTPNRTRSPPSFYNFQRTGNSKK